MSYINIIIIFSQRLILVFQKVTYFGSALILELLGCKYVYLLQLFFYGDLKMWYFRVARRDDIGA